MTEKKTLNIHWEILVATVVMVGTLLGVTIPLHQSIREDIRVVHQESRQQLDAIYQEMKDFHGRLCAIEERNKRNG